MPRPKQHPEALPNGESPESDETPFEKFASLAKRLVAVSKEELKQKEREQTQSEPKTAP